MDKMDQETEYIEHSIELTLNSSGYEGKDIDQVLPDFISDRPVRVGVAWAPSAEGPESLTLLIAVGIYAATKLAEGFMSELSKDIYTWAKTKILPLLNKKRYPTGHIIIKLKDVTLLKSDRCE
jgi:hypothetical protein